MAATDWDGDAFTALTTTLLAALEHLAPTERAVFLLREVFELDFDEIATSVGITEANARGILTRARRRLRESDRRGALSRAEPEEQKH
jgi:RNA polymerase sigma factor (sigma-70 family)